MAGSHPHAASCLQLGNSGLGILRQALQKVLRMTTGHSTSGITPPLPDQMVGVGGSSGAGGVSQLSSQSEPTGGTPWTPPDSAAGVMLLRVPGDTGALQRPAQWNTREDPTLGAWLPSGFERGQWRSLVAMGGLLAPWHFHLPWGLWFSKPRLSVRSQGSPWAPHLSSQHRCSQPPGWS